MWEMGCTQLQELEDDDACVEVELWGQIAEVPQLAECVAVHPKKKPSEYDTHPSIIS
jgi:hypothetical protein